MATIARNALLRGAGALTLALAVSGCGQPDVTTTCKTAIDAAATALDIHKSVSACLKDRVADATIREALKTRSEILLKGGKVGAFAAAMPPEPDVVEGVHNNVRRYSIRSLLAAPDGKPRVLHLGFEFTEGAVSGIVFDVNERQEPGQEPGQQPRQDQAPDQAK